MRRLWKEAWDRMNQVYDLASEQGFFEDLHDIHYARQHVAFEPRFAHTKANTMLRVIDLERKLDWWSTMTDTTPPRDEATERWWLLPRERARTMHFHTFTASLPGQPRPEHGRLLFKAVGRLIDGDDLVYAIGPKEMP